MEKTSEILVEHRVNFRQGFKETEKYIFMENLV
jgi:hypothetical protein